MLLLQSLLVFQKINFYLGLCPFYVDEKRKNNIFSVNRQSLKYSILFVIVIFVIFFFVNTYTFSIIFYNLFTTEGFTNRINDAVYLNFIFYTYYLTIINLLKNSYRHARFLNRLRSIELKLRQFVGNNNQSSILYPTMTICHWIILGVCQTISILSSMVYTLNAMRQKNFILNIYYMTVALTALTNVFVDIYLRYLIVIQVKLYEKINQLLMETLSRNVTHLRPKRNEFITLFYLISEFHEVPQLFLKSFDLLLCSVIFRHFSYVIDFSFNCINNIFSIDKITKLFLINLTKMPTLLFFVILTMSAQLLQQKVRIL